MMQALLVAVGAALLLFAGHAWGRIAASGEAEPADELDARRAPPAAQVIVPAVLGLGALVAAISLQSGGGVRLPTPARLDRMRAGPDPALAAEVEPRPEAEREGEEGPPA